MVSLILLLNKLFRRPRVGGRESKEAYSEWEYAIGKELVKTYLTPAGDIAGKSILDVGCGLGGKTVAYGSGGADGVFGTDISVENLEAAYDYALNAGGSFRWGFFAGDASNLPLTDNTVDTVVANDAMEHFADPEGALSEIKRVVKVSGAVWFFFTPHFSPLGSHLYDYIYIPWCHLLFCRRHLESAIRRVLRERRQDVPEHEIQQEVNEIMRSYDEDLNHMSIRRFLRILKQFPSLGVTYMKFEPAKFKFLKMLTWLPLVRELFTGTVVCRLVKLR